VLARVTQRARALFYTRGTPIVGDRIMYAAECLHTRYSGLGRTATAAYARTTQSSDVGELFSISRRRDFRTVPLLLTGRPVTVEPGRTLRGEFQNAYRRRVRRVDDTTITRTVHRGPLRKSKPIHPNCRLRAFRTAIGKYKSARVAATLFAYSRGIDRRNPKTRRHPIDDVSR